MRMKFQPVQDVDTHRREATPTLCTCHTYCTETSYSQMFAYNRSFTKHILNNCVCQ